MFDGLGGAVGRDRAVQIGLAHVLLKAVVASGVEAAVDGMFVEQGHARERLGTLDTFVLFDIAVGLHVCPQVGTIGEGARTNVTLEGFLARVGAHVALQQPRPTETLAAYLALARQRMGADVHLEGAQRRVRLLAVLAGELLLNLCGTVELFVLGEAAECRVALAAAVALVAGQAART